MEKMNRDETIKRIRDALKRRSGKPWSVTGVRGTAWGWIRIDAPPARRHWVSVTDDPARLPSSPWREVWDESNHGYMGPDDRAELAALLGLDNVHCQGASIPASDDYWQEYVARAEGRAPDVYGRQYWD